MEHSATFLYFATFLFLSGSNYASGAGTNLGGMESWGFNGVRSGEVTMMSPTKLKIRGFDYSGEGPAVWFMVGKEEEPYNEEFAELKGTIIPDETGSCDRLVRYRNEDIMLTLPAGMKFTDYDYLAIYCTRFNHNFGYVQLKKNGVAPVFDQPAADTASTATTEKLPKACPQDHLEEEEEEEEENEETGKEKEKEDEDEDEEEEEEEDLSRNNNKRSRIPKSTGKSNKKSKTKLPGFRNSKPNINSTVSS